MNAFETDVLEHLVLPHFIPKPPRIKIATISIDDLYCRVIEKKNEDAVAHPIQESPFYKYILGDKEAAHRYLKEKIGIKRPDAKLREFQALVNNFEYLSEAYKYNYICTYERGGKYFILDGQHRASILKHRGVRKLDVVVFLHPRFRRLKKLRHLLNWREKT
ncbi:MAG: hypothetical protein C9356_04840 [Oleiphilus sp.]|nr:MAG: hypothetical protein C9356_04840 [Oleiphilus sp.]